MAKKKIYDIIPPGERREILGISKKPLAGVFASEGKRQGRVFAFSRKKIFYTLLLVLTVTLVYWFFSVASTVEIEIFPNSEPLVVSTTVFFATDLSEPTLSPFDLSQTVIPVSDIEIERTFTKRFPASEVALQEKAQGTIRVFSKHNRAVTLVKGTRFLSATEPTRQFHTQNKIIVPIGGYVDVLVIASESGEGHNIGSSTFSVPGLRNFSPPQLFFNIFGRSFTDMEGGRREISRIITQESLQSAQEEMLEIVRQDIRVILEEVAGEGFKILPNSIELEIIQGKALNVKEGQEVDDFAYQAEIRATGLKAQRSFLLELAKELIITDLAMSKDFAKEFLSIRFLPRRDEVLGGVSVETRRIKEGVEISTKIFSKVDKDSLYEVVKGRTRRDISRQISNIHQESFRAPRIKFSPFWARRLSSEPKSVEIRMGFQ